MPATYMLRKHLAAMEAANRPEAVKDRQIHIEACKRAKNERDIKFPVINSENFEAANSYQNARLEYWRDCLK